jgi:DNA polymerase epsilon subunit 1
MLSPEMRKHYLRKWLKLPVEFDCSDFRDIIDWDYYRERLGKSIAKIITIPAGTQAIQNPCPRVAHPVWLQRRLKELLSGKKQSKISALFGPKLITGADRALTTAGSPAATDEGAPASALKRSSPGVVGALPFADLEDIGSPTRGQASIAGQAGAVVRAHRYARSSSSSGALGGIDDNTAGYESGDNADTGSGVAASAVTVASPSKTTIATVPPMLTTKPQTAAEMNEWLAARKVQWRDRRQQFKAASRAAARPNAERDAALKVLQEAELGVDAQGRKRVTSVTDMVRNAALAASFKSWQVIEIMETDSPGSFTVWAMTGTAQLQRLTVTVPRMLLMNCRGREAEDSCAALGGTRVKSNSKTLPHRRQVHTHSRTHPPVPLSSFLLS